jgi:hypothetical protein
MGTDFPNPQPMNPRGFFEDNEVIYLHSLLRCRLGSEAEYEQFIRKREAMGVTWGWKDMYTARFFPLAQRLIRQPLKVIATQRPIHESIESWCTQKRCHPKEAENIITSIEQEKFLALLQFDGPVLHVRYHDLIADPAKWVNAIAQFAGMTPNDAALEFVDPTLHRHRSE